MLSRVSFITMKVKQRWCAVKRRHVSIETSIDGSTSKYKTKEDEDTKAPMDSIKSS